MNIITKKSGGYTLLFAVLTAAIVLGVAVFILSISRGQYLLASTARESTYAIYAADSGIECAAKSVLEQDMSTSTGPSGATINCAANVDVPIPEFNPKTGLPGFDDIEYAYQSYLYMDLGGSRCVQITINKGLDSEGNLMTQIESRGYNYCSGSGTTALPDSSNPKVVERAIRLTYVGM